MGKVYKAFATKIKDKVALKLIRPEIASDRETLERFGNELRLARKISHRRPANPGGGIVNEPQFSPCLTHTLGPDSQSSHALIALGKAYQYLMHMVS